MIAPVNMEVVQAVGPEKARSVAVAVGRARKRASPGGGGMRGILATELRGALTADEIREVLDILLG